MQLDIMKLVKLSLITVGQDISCFTNRTAHQFLLIP